MIHPENRAKQYWNALILIFTVYFAVEVPLRLTLGYHPEGWFFIFDMFVLGCFLVDVILNFFTATYINGVLVTNRKQVAIFYLKGWFIVDIMAAIPFDLFLVGSFSALTDSARVIRLVRLARLARIAQFMRKLAQADIINISILRMMFLTFWVVMIAHWAACGWIALGGGNIPEADQNDVARLYIRSLYWATTTITTIGYGDITPATNIQTIFTMFFQLMGAAMYGYVIGNIASLIANLDVARAQYLEKLEKIGTFMKFKKIPVEMQHDIRSYYTYLWDTRRGYDEAQVLADLPRPLVEKVSMYLLQTMIEKVPIFTGASPDLIRQIVVALKPEVYTPGDFVFRKGDIGNTMFFIARGGVQVVGDDGTTVFATLKEGNFFGEIALIMSSPRTASIRAMEFCDLYTLDKDTFNEIVSNYPKFAEHILELARERQTEVGKREDPNAIQYARPAQIRKIVAKAQNGAVLLTWEPMDHAAVYQVIRRDSGKWRLLNGFIQSAGFIDDHPQEGAGSYRIRAANQAGTGDWSDPIEVAL